MSLETDTARLPAAAPGPGLTAMKRAEDASLSMSLSSELSDSSLLSASGQRSVSTRTPTLAPSQMRGFGGGDGAPGPRGGDPPFLRFFS